MQYAAPRTERFLRVTEGVPRVTRCVKLNSKGNAGEEKSHAARSLVVRFPARGTESVGDKSVVPYSPARESLTSGPSWQQIVGQKKAFLTSGYGAHLSSVSECGCYCGRRHAQSEGLGDDGHEDSQATASITGRLDIDPRETLIKPSLSTADIS